MKKNRNPSLTMKRGSKRTFVELLGELDGCESDEAVSVASHLVSGAAGRHLMFLRSPVGREDDDDDDGYHGDETNAGKSGTVAAANSKGKEEAGEEDETFLHLTVNRDGGYRPTQWQLSVLRTMHATRSAKQHKVGLLVVATGLGKTVIAILDVDHELELLDDARVNRLRRPARSGGIHHENATRVLFLVHSTAIRDAAYAKFLAHFGSQFPTTTFLNYKGKSGGDLRNVLFVFALFQSFDKLKASDFSHVIIDEVHHVLAPSFRQHTENLLQHCNYALGMTATLQHRVDANGTRIRALFLDTVYFTYSWMAAKKTHFPKDVEYLEALPLLQGGADVPTYEACLREFRQKDSIAHFLGMLQKSLTLVSMDDPRPLLSATYIVKMIEQYQEARRAAGLEPRRQILVFAQSVGDAEAIASLLSAKGEVSAAAVSHKSTDASSTLQSFIDGKLRCLVSCNMLSEGFDVPGVDCCVLARLTESEIVFSQQLGRVFRGQKSVTIIDLALNLRRRWQRLRADITDNGLKEMILEFFPVSNFWPYLLE